MQNLKIRMKLLILYIIYNHEEIHGYGIKKEIQSRIKNYELSPGSLYPILNSLERTGLIEKIVLNHKKIYKITNLGKDYINKHKKELDQFLKHIDNFNKLYDYGLKELLELIKNLITFDKGFSTKNLETFDILTKEYIEKVKKVFKNDNRG